MGSGSNYNILQIFEPLVYVEFIVEDSVGEQLVFEYHSNVYTAIHQYSSTQLNALKQSEVN